MPMYTHHCDRCGRDNIVICKISERDDERYCECGNQLKRVLDKPGLVYGPTSSPTGSTLR